MATNERIDVLTSLFVSALTAAIGSRLDSVEEQLRSSFLTDAAEEIATQSLIRVPFLDETVCTSAALQAQVALTHIAIRTLGALTEKNRVRVVEHCVSVFLGALAMLGTAAPIGTLIVPADAPDPLPVMKRPGIFGFLKKS